RGARSQGKKDDGYRFEKCPRALRCCQAPDPLQEMERASPGAEPVPGPASGEARSGAVPADRSPYLDGTSSVVVSATTSPLSLVMRCRFTTPPGTSSDNQVLNSTSSPPFFLMVPERIFTFISLSPTLSMPGSFLAPVSATRSSSTS